MSLRGMYDDDYEDYLHKLGWLDHTPGPEYPRAGHVGEFVYAEDWQALMLKLPRYGWQAPNSMLAGILSQHPRAITARHAKICARVVCWLGTSCGQSIIFTARSLQRDLNCGGGRAFLAAWAWDNERSVGLNHGYRSIEHLLAKPSDFGFPWISLPALGKQLMRRPRLSVDEYECVEHLIAWLGGEEGTVFITRAEQRIEEINRFERATRLAKHRAELEQQRQR